MRDQILCSWRPLDDRIEPKPFNSELFDRNDPLVYEIMKNGIQLI